MTDLLPCPFCGGEAEQDLQQAYRSMQIGRIDHGAAVYCTGCNANMIMCRGDHPELSDEERMSFIVEDWNRRTPSPQPNLRVAAGAAEKEIRRLHKLLTPHYAGKVCEPSLAVADQLRDALDTEGIPTPQSREVD